VTAGAPVAGAPPVAEGVDEGIDEGIDEEVDEEVGSGSEGESTGAWTRQAIVRRLEDIGGEGEPGRELLTRLVHSFLGRAPAEVAALVEAVTDGDAAEVERQAHSLGGAAGNIGAVGLAAVCAELEGCGRRRQLDGAAGPAARLEEELRVVQAALGAVLAGL
jgi:HPt (histidine-containing phosphotransfer) domain-containing protein